MTRPSRILLSALLVLSVAFAVVTPVFADAPVPKTSAVKYEIKFNEDMIDHHMMAVMMAEECLEKANHDELIQMCNNIIVTQSDEMMMMQSWLLDWYGISYEPQMKQHNGGQHEAMDSAEFEVMFMDMMVKHHAGAVKDAQKCQDRAYHDELIDLCGNIEVTQSQEIATMQTWLCDWYGICKF